MRIMVTGARGMLGQAVVKAGKLADHYMIPIPHDRGDIRNYNAMAEIIKIEKPDALINCAGITHHMKHEPYEYFQVNSIAAKRLSYACSQHDVSMVQISTDCVFDGVTGAPYHENSHEYSNGYYGMSKLFGELDDDHLTIRCSFIGKEGGLLRWLFDQEGRVPGFVNARWNGMSVYRAAEEIVYQASIETKGILHIFGQDTTKYEVLCAANEVFKLGLEIVPVDEPKIDRRLFTTRKEYKMALPGIKEQLGEVI